MGKVVEIIFYRISVSICMLLFIFTFENAQQVHYATRFRNFSYISEKKIGTQINSSIFQFNMEHRLSYAIEIYQNLHITEADVVVERCTHENYACEYFQTWKFNSQLNHIVYMKNQIWTPLFKYHKPKLNFNNFPKGIHVNTNGTLDTGKLKNFYADITKYFYRIYINVYENGKRKRFTLFMEFNLFEYGNRNARRG